MMGYTSTYVYDGAGDGTLVSVTPREGLGAMPVDMVLVLDTSGSMSRPSNEKAEGVAALYSRLDLVKHCVRIAEGALRESDRLGIVQFDSDVRLVSRLDDDDVDIDAALNALEAGGATNMWGGLEVALEHAKQAGRPEALKTVFLLTDGEPMPARREGEDNLTKRWFQENAAEANVTLHTFGFGYNLDTALLVRMAHNGLGSFNFVPDHSMLATVINCALANVGTTVLDHADVPLPGGSQVAVLGGPHDIRAGHVRLHSLRAGQTRHLLLRGEHAIEGAERVDADKELFLHQMARVSFIDGVRTAHQLARLDLDDARRVLRNQVVPKLVSPDSPLAADVYGQVSEAIATRAAFERWGVHYLPSLIGAHCDERVNNFKDPGVAAYTTPAYEEALGRLEQAFDALAVPAPTLVPNMGGAMATGIPVAVGGASFRDAFYNQSGGCLTADTLVTMADGTQRRADALRKGDAVRTPEGVGAVACVCVGECAGNRVEVVELAPGVALTPWHPVRRASPSSSSWEFPAKLGATVTRTNTPEVFNLLLEPGHTGVVCGGEYYAITLAHGISDDAVAAHAFFGTSAVAEAYARLPGYADGRVVLPGGALWRDAATGRVGGLLAGAGAGA